MADKTINAVRQVIINELGLSRETVKQMTEKTVRELAQQKIDAYFVGTDLVTFTERQVSKQVSSWGSDRELLRKTIDEAIKEAVRTEARRMFTDMFSVRIETKGVND